MKPNIESDTTVDDEFLAAQNAAALFDRSSCGRIEITGADRNEFIQRMSTNDMRGLKSGTGLQTVLTTPEARVVDLLTIYARAETLWVLTSRGSLPRVTNWFRGQIFFRDKVKVTDVTGAWAQLSLVGPQAATVLRSLGVDPPDRSRFTLSEAKLNGTDILLGTLPVLADGSFELFVPEAATDSFSDALVAAGNPFGLLVAGSEAYEMLRIANGIPAYGSELSEEVNALEAGLRQAICFSKGCYTGQEVIARLDTYQRQKQVLARLKLDSAPIGALPLPIEHAGVPAGQLTSVARLPIGVVVGLGFIRSKEQGADHYDVVDGTSRITAKLATDRSEAGSI